MRICCAVAAVLLACFAAHAKTAGAPPNQAASQDTQSGFSPLYLGVEYETDRQGSHPVRKTKAR
jgi:hypothetical protein